MLTKQHNSILDMFGKVHGLYKNVDIEGTGELGIEVVGHAISITNDPLTVMLFIHTSNDGFFVVQKYAYDGDRETLVGTKDFGDRDLPGLEDYIIAAFTN